MTVAETIERKLKAALTPLSLQVIDESHLHAGHAGARPEGETHFRVEVVAEAFAGKSRLERQRIVYNLLADELAGPVHALSVSANPSQKPV
ncbi:MAG: BolA family protein [Rhodospirillaceae bacterium]